MAIDPEHIQLTDEQKEVLANAAEQSGRDWSELLSEALRVYRLPSRHRSSQNGASLYDALSSDGLIGIVRDAPSDLSTNPKYMEGFGRDRETGTD